MIARRKRAAALALLICLPAQAQEESKDSRVTAALSLFGEACVKQAGRNDQVATWALLHQLAQMETEQSAYFLRGQKGIAWSAPSGDSSFALVAREPATCSVWAHHADAQEAATWFQRLLRQSMRHGETLEDVADRSFEGIGGTYQLRAWRVRGDGAALLFTIIVTESVSDEVPAQMIVSVSPVADDGKRP